MERRLRINSCSYYQKESTRQAAEARKRSKGLLRATADTEGEEAAALILSGDKAAATAADTVKGDEPS